MIDWDKTNLVEFMSHSKCQQDEACKALAGFEYPVNSERENELRKLWLFKNLLTQYSWQSREEFIDSAIENGYPPPWLDFAIERGLYVGKQKAVDKVKPYTKIKAIQPANIAAALADAEFEKLFEPVTVAALEKMFPANGKWSGWAEKAKSNNLINARVSRAMFNPYKAAMWFCNKGIDGYDLARCYRILANNLPARSKGSEQLLTGKLN